MLLLAYFGILQKPRTTFKTDKDRSIFPTVCTKVVGWNRFYIPTALSHAAQLLRKSTLTIPLPISTIKWSWCWVDDRRANNSGRKKQYVWPFFATFVSVDQYLDTTFAQIIIFTTCTTWLRNFSCHHQLSFRLFQGRMLRLYHYSILAASIWESLILSPKTGRDPRSSEGCWKGKAAKVA